nr:hypothetical protein [uncultured Mediterranean phage uvMED]
MFKATVITTDKKALKPYRNQRPGKRTKQEQKMPWGTIRTPSIVIPSQIFLPKSYGLAYRLTMVCNLTVLSLVMSCTSFHNG